MKEITELIGQVRKWWPQPAGLISLLLVELALILMIDAAADLDGVTVLATGLALFVPTMIAYLFARRPPRPRKGTIGFAVTITCEDDKTQRLVRGDFVAHLRQLIEGGSSKHRFSFIEVPPHLAEQAATAEGRERLRKNMRCHFVLHGRVRTRRLADSNRYIIDLGGMVSHRPLKQDAQAHLAQEFTELIPGRVDFQDSEGLVGFEFTSRWAHIVAKYVIGLAMALSGFFDDADAMLREVDDLVSRVRDELPAYAKIRERVPQVRAAMQMSLARQRYERWTEDRNPDHIAAMALHLGQADVLKTSPIVIVFRAIIFFVRDRDCSIARQVLNSIPESTRDAVWHYNQGFLYAYGGNLRKANHHYRVGAQLDVPPEKIAELELFMAWVASVEPDKYQVHYALALLNEFLKGDTRSAAKEYAAFLAKVPKDKHKSEQRSAQAFIARTPVDVSLDDAVTASTA